VSTCFDSPSFQVTPDFQISILQVFRRHGVIIGDKKKTLRQIQGDNPIEKTKKGGNPIKNNVGRKTY
jgi:hypothetical protein